jgi:hypothetical protein
MRSAVVPKGCRVFNAKLKLVYEQIAESIAPARDKICRATAVLFSMPQTAAGVADPGQSDLPAKQSMPGKVSLAIPILLGDIYRCAAVA